MKDAMINLNEELNNIIFEYQLDQYYPKYRKMLEACRILENLIKDSISLSRKTLFMGNEKTMLNLVRQHSKGSEIIDQIQYSEEKLDELKTVHWNQFDRVILLPFHNVRCAERWLKNQNIRYEWIYDIFEDYQLYFESEFYVLNTVFVRDSVQKSLFFSVDGEKTAQNNLQLQLYIEQERYEVLKEPWKKRTLEKMFFLAVNMKNFILAKQYYNLFVDQYGSDKRFESAWKEIEELLVLIKEKIKERPQRDIIMYWMDELPYHEIDAMPYVKGLADEGISFKNMFTCLPHTRPTFYSIFYQHKSLIDWLERMSDDGTEGTLITYLEQNGYEFKVISGEMYWLNEKYCACTRRELYTPVSCEMWDLMQQLLTSKKPLFVLVHGLAETHTPCLNSNMLSGSILNYYDRFREGQRELDAQIKFYDECLSQSTLRIFMSDHGKSLNCRFHVHFYIVGWMLAKRSVESLCTLADVYTIVKQLMEQGNIDESDFTREYIEIQELPRYNKDDIKRMISNKYKIFPEHVGYIGVITKKYKYLRFFTGDELLEERKVPKPDEIDILYNVPFEQLEICDEAKLPYFRNIVGEYPTEILENKKLKYSRLLLKVYQNIKKRRETIRHLINMSLDNVQGTIGIRFGGIHSYELFDILTEKNQQKIACIFDKKINCKCANLNIPILAPENIVESSVEAIILSSFDNLELLKEESKTYPERIKAIDIYGYMEEHGYLCKGNFFEESYDEDYDVWPKEWK